MERFNDRPLESVPCGDTGEGLRTVKLCGWGAVQSTHGSFTVDEAGAEALVAAFQAHGVELPVDVEHSTLDAGRPPEQRGAVGWVTRVFAEVGKGLFGMVKWTDKGRTLIREGAFKYLSPVFMIGKDDRRVLALHSAAVTNKPALVAAEVLAASQGAGAGDENAAIVANVRTALGLPAAANADAIALALSMRASSGGNTAAEAELVALKEVEKQRAAKALVDRFVTEHRLNPNDKPAFAAAERLALSDPAMLEAILGRAAQHVVPGRTNPPTTRQLEIAKAEREFRGDVRHGKVTTLRAFVDDSLRSEGREKLTDDEARELVRA